jgi:hypothetical protein
MTLIHSQSLHNFSFIFSKLLRFSSQKVSNTALFFTVGLALLASDTLQYNICTSKKHEVTVKFKVKHLRDVGIHSDNHVQFRSRLAKIVPSRVRLLDTGRCILRSG